MMSDESENDGVYVENHENDIYYKKYKLLLERCGALQKENERLVFRYLLLWYFFILDIVYQKL